MVNLYHSSFRDSSKILGLVIFWILLSNLYNNCISDSKTISGLVMFWATNPTDELVKKICIVGHDLV